MATKSKVQLQEECKQLRRQLGERTSTIRVTADGQISTDKVARFIRGGRVITIIIARKE